MERVGAFSRKFASQKDYMKRFLSLVTLMAALSVNAQGTYEAIIGSSSTNPPLLATLTGTAGWNFQPTTNIEVIALGALNPVVTGSGTIFVGLWDAAGTLLASNAVTSSSTLASDSRFESITPITLFPGQTYHLGAYAANGTIGFAIIDLLAGDTLITAPYLDLLGAVGANDAFAFPTGTGEDAGLFYMAPNLQFITVVPEPSVLSLALVGGMAWFVRRSRR